MTKSTTRNLTSRGRATRDRIVETAARVIMARGVAGTTIQDVMAEAGVSTSQVYHYFSDKSELVAAVIEFHAGLGDPGAPADLDSVEKLETWCRNAIRTQVERDFIGGCELGSLASELAETSEGVRMQLVQAFASWEAPLRRGLRAMHARGELREGTDPDDLALALLAALQGGILLTQTRRDIAPLRAVLTTVMARVRDSVVAPTL
ncbi:TetR/AcrR family transcriptional regulator [Umezawaea tangerina]|uniref:TetR family transcriptional regulator n=1 Tax=Umezawaea tangerina TaxID=84725 RepID=A0A2T0SSJ8_9PSEU|nr:TetR/AcrR family transcriptional regulator [Umezawaea tangerina]PRY36353.1 TetR family transcriptional regulator [Umezawaea tangerina]